MTTRTTTRIATWGTVMTVLLAACATAPQPVAWKAAPIGSSWSAMQRNTGSFGADMQSSVTRAPDIDWKGSPAMVLKTATGGMLVQQLTDGRWLAMLAPTGQPVTTFDPPAGWTQPIALGDSWKRQQTMTNVATGRKLEFEWSCTVPAREKVTVPAGTFEALRVECVGSHDARDTYWVSPAVHPFLKTQSVRGSRYPTGPGTQETELLKLPS